MPNTLHLIDSLVPSGAATQLRLLTAAGAQRGDQVLVGALRSSSEQAARFASAGVEVVGLGKRFGLDPFAAGRLRRRIRREQIEVVQTWDFASARLLWLAMLGRHRLHWVHTVRDKRCEPSGNEPWMGRMLRSANAVIVPTDEIALRARRLGVDPSTIHQVRNGFAESIHPGGPQQREKAREDLIRSGAYVTQSSSIVVALARMDDPSRLMEIIWAADLLRVVRPELRLLMVGTGPSRMACERFAEQAIEKGIVHFLGEQEKIEPLLAAADIFWCASASSTEPTPLVEAMAAGLPAVVGVDGPESYGNNRLIDATTSRSVRWNDRANWARQTDRLLGDQALCQQMGRSAADRVTQRHASDVVAEDHAAVLVA